jgi:2-succinyl-6-hydroxy-2,4-cyclohexadiene-1-carboxylate synthase
MSRLRDYVAARYVLLHGFAGSPASWYETLAAAAPALPPWAPRICGHGERPRRRTGSSSCHDGFLGEVRRLAGWLAARPRSPGELRVVAGYSLGGRLALGLVLERPDLFDAAVLVSAHPGLEREDEREARRAADERWSLLLEQEGMNAFVSAWETQPVFASQETLPASARALQRHARLRHDPRALAGAMRALSLGAMPPYVARLEEVELPVCWLVGERDAKFRALAEASAARMPHARVEVLPGCGHNPLLEAPVALARALRRAAVEANENAARRQTLDA